MSETETQAPSHRTRLGRALSNNQLQASLVLQQCEDCNTIQYPPREVCKHCLSDALTWRAVDDRGEVLASSSLHNSLEPYYQERLPWELASVKLDAGPVALVHNGSGYRAGDRVRVVSERDARGNLLLAISQSTKAAKSEENP